jgi:thiamine-phosphate pyrophosphorylase
MHSKLQYISQGATSKEQIENIKSALDAGIKWIQLRYKNAVEIELMGVAEEVKSLCLTYNALFIINDNVPVAKTINADGVHLGLNDMVVTKAREFLGENKIIGGTANTFEDVVKRISEKCNYVGLGPYRFTSTKEKLSPVLGLQGYEKIISMLQSQKLEIPIYAIGGITEDDVEAIMRTGITGIAVSGTITNHHQKKELIQKFNSLLYEEVNNSR